MKREVMRENVRAMLHVANTNGASVEVSAEVMRALCERWLAVEDAATGECVEVGDDEEGQPRALIHSTRDELRRGKPLAFQRVRIIPDAGKDADGR